jgi:DNA-binding transcriptional ArsR family regulator
MVGIIIFKSMNMINKIVTETNPYDQQAQILKILTHPARLAILDILRDGEHCVCHMEAHLGYRQAYLSQQIAVLRKAGLIQDRRDGWNIFYHVTDPRIYVILDAVQSVIGEKISIHGKEDVQCPCPHCSPNNKA